MASPPPRALLVETSALSRRTGGSAVAAPGWDVDLERLHAEEVVNERSQTGAAIRDTDEG